MNKQLKTIQGFINNNKHLTREEKDAVLKAVKDVDKELEITSFKLERTEKVKKTTAILLEETIEELEQKRKAVEEQNRNLEIEAALERVRARTMAMHNSSELAEVAVLLFEQIKRLGLESFSSGFNIWDNEHKNLISWMSNATGKINPPFELPIQKYEQHRRIYTAWEKQELFMEDDIIGTALVNHYKFLRSFPLLDESFNLAEAAGIKIPERQVHNIAFFSFGYLLFITIEPCPQFHSIFQRFAKVFQQTYTRFLDLQKSEAQAREAQIELALERVRARSMAMQQSGELKDTALLLFQQVKSLEINAWGCGFNIWDDDKKFVTSWNSSEGQIEPPVRFPSDQDVFLRFYEAAEKGESLYVEEMGGEALVSHYKFLSTLPGINDILEQFSSAGIEVPKSQTFHASFFSHGYLLFITYETVPEAHNIFVRFAKVFEQTYTRFLDLQKAEAQVRESQIEAALERVRARSMGMQKSNELKDVVRLLYKEFRILVTDIHSVNIQLKLDSSKDIHFWASVEEDIYPELYHIPYSGLPIFEKFYDAFNSPGEGFFDYLLNKEEKDAFFSEVFKIQPVPPQRKKMIQNAEGMVMTGWFHKHSGIDILRYNLKRFSEEEKEIVKRFAAAFEQTYIRFLDLQKAEAHAREAEIELALERVRARTMAMHKSDELADTAGVLFEQMVSLGIVPKRCLIGIINRITNNANFWLTSSDGKVIPGADIVPLTEEKHLINMYHAWKEKKTHFSFKLSGEERVKWTMYIINKVKMRLPEYQPDIINKEQIFNEPAVFNSFFFSQGFVVLHTVEELAEEHIKMLKRFAKVFEQTYTRFFDLQKAESQAREAQIEAALERVRASAMAMHISEDINRAILTVFNELEKLDLDILRCGIGIINKKSRSADIWTAVKHDKESAIEVSSKEKFDQHPLSKGIFDAWLKQEDFYYVLEGNDLDEYYSAVASTNLNMPQSNSLVQETKDKKQYFYTSTFNAGNLYVFNEKQFPDDHKKIINRFASVLNLTFNRFLDLQKAEAQAREAQIEAALERVRSRTMGMQKSDELAETAAVVFQQLMILGIEPNRIYIAIIKDELGNCEFWITDEDGSRVSSGFMANLNDNSSFKKMYEGWKNKKKSITLDMQGKELEEYFQHLGKLNVPFKDGLTQKRRIQNVAYFAKGFIGIASPELQKDVNINLLERFAYVFDLTYTRFNDLKQAEAQNKMIQAENERKTRELEEARQLQLSMLPKKLPQLPNLDIAVYMKTATEVGGDYYDFNVGLDGTLSVALGDATGHGMKAGTIVSMIKALFDSNSSRLDMKAFFEQSSATLKGIELGRLMMAFMMLKFKDNMLEISNAGMPPLFIYKKQKQEVEEIQISGMPLGAMRGFPYQIRRTELFSGDTILLLSDGLPELKNEKDEQYSYESVYESFKLVAEKKPEEIITYLKKEGSNWVNGKEPDDDVTFVVIKVK